jgi:hypothetical protein
MLHMSGLQHPPQSPQREVTGQGVVARRDPEHEARALSRIPYWLEIEYSVYCIVEMSFARFSRELAIIVAASVIHGQMSLAEHPWRVPSR